MANQMEAQRTSESEFSDIMACQTKQIEKLEANCNMHYELGLGLASNSHLHGDLSHSRANPPEVSISSVQIAEKDEETVQQAQGNMEIGNTKLEHNLQAAIKQEALSCQGVNGDNGG